MRSLASAGKPSLSQHSRNILFKTFWISLSFYCKPVAMEHTSIDGRRRNKTSVPVLYPSRKSETDATPSLRPASPPKSNPWAPAKKPPIISATGIFPPLPKPQAPWSPVKTPTADISRASSLSPGKKRSGDDTASGALAPGSTSPSSITSSSSRHIFEAAAPRATSK
jgi:hypothetical protein